MPQKRILTITTAGTIFQKAVNGKMEPSLSIPEFVAQAEFDGVVDVYDLGVRSGSEMIFETIIKIRDMIVAEQNVYDGIVVVTGTDSLEEVGFALDLLLDIDTPVLLTGAMKPSDIRGYDGIANYSEALQVAASNESKNKGVLVYLNDSIHLARYVRKTDSALIGSFTSHPGPIGEVRCGKVIFYYEAPVKSETFLSLDLAKLYSVKVPIWTMTVSPYFPFEMLSEIDGLVIAGMGTGSVAAHLVNELSDTWTQILPIVLSSRCHIGLSYDDNYYKGSKEKYESKGFLIEDYASLNPLQARIRLCLELCRS